MYSQQLESSSNSATHDYKRDEATHNPKEPGQSRHILTRNCNVHSKKSRHHMQWNEDCGQDGHLAEDFVDVQTQA